MLTKRIIPCLDVKNGQVVKGKGFVNLKYAGNPVKLARKYYEDGADELVFLDITASYEKRKTMLDLVEKVAKQIFIPFTVGGGISTIQDIIKFFKTCSFKICPFFTSKHGIILFVSILTISLAIQFRLFRFFQGGIA